MNQRQHWIITADGRRASLFACTTTLGGELHVDHIRSLENGHEREQDRHRPTLLGGSERRGTAGRSGAHAAPHSVSQNHAAEEDQLRYAREVGEWLVNESRELGIAAGAGGGGAGGPKGRISVFAPPKLLGLLRDRMVDLRAVAEFHEAELSHLSPAELAAHPAVRNALVWPAAT